MKKRLPILLIFACAAVFVLGVMQLFRLRFEAGDVYPEYSSLRADPLGTMALYESLAELPGISVRRDHSSANLLPDARDTTYLHLAARVDEWDSFPEKTWKEIDAYLINGGRLAITFFPEASWNFWTAGTTPTTTATNAAGTNAPGFTTASTRKKASLKKIMKQSGADAHEISLEDHWGVDFDQMKLPQGDNETYEPVKVFNATRPALPRALDWHSATVFATNLDSAWHTIYQRGKHAVVIERKFGAGTVVMATDSFFLSNEALRKDRHADLLAWLVGPNRRVVFDEAHLGIVEQGGIAVLIRKYRLHGLALGLLALAGLFIWKNSVSLVPADAGEKLSPHVAGKDAAAGFVNLLRRNIPARDILNLCFTEWTKTLLSGRHYTIAGVDQAQAAMEAENALPPRSRDPVRAYKKICEVLTRPVTNKTPEL